MAKWISVKEKLPPKDTPIIINLHYNNGTDFVTAGEMEIWRNGTVVFYPDEYDPSASDEYETTHWMPLPDPPVED